MKSLKKKMAKTMQELENRVNKLEEQMYRVASILLEVTELQKTIQDDLIKLNMKIDLLHKIKNE